jgi:hypothetical protein
VRANQARGPVGDALICRDPRTVQARPPRPPDPYQSSFDTRTGWGGKDAKKPPTNVRPTVVVEVLADAASHVRVSGWGVRR